MYDIHIRVYYLALPVIMEIIISWGIHASMRIAMEPHTHCHLIIGCWIFFHHCRPTERLTEDQLGHQQKASLCPKWAGWVRNQSVHKWWGSGSFCTRSRFSSLLQESDEEMGRCSRSQHQSLVLSIVRTAKVCACSSFCLLRLLLFFPLSIFVTALKC
jgi:hypothetical protein